MSSSGRTGITPNMMMNGMRITPTLPGSISGMNRKVSMRIKSIGTDTLCRLLRNEEAWEFDNEVFDRINPSTNLPYGYKLKKEINHEYTIIEAAV